MWWWWDSSIYIYYLYIMNEYYRYIHTNPLFISDYYEEHWLESQIFQKNSLKLWIWCIIFFIIFIALYLTLLAIDKNLEFSYQWSLFWVMINLITVPKWFLFAICSILILNIYIIMTIYYNFIAPHINGLWPPHGIIYHMRVLAIADVIWIRADIFFDYNVPFYTIFDPEIQKIYGLPCEWNDYYCYISDADIQYLINFKLFDVNNKIILLISDSSIDSFRITDMLAFGTDYCLYEEGGEDSDVM